MLKKMSKKWKIVTAVLAVTLLTAVFGVGLVLADDPEPYGPGPHCEWGGHGPGMGRGGFGPGMGWGDAETSMLDVAAEALDMTPGQLWDELRAGKSLEDIAAEKGLEPKDLAQAFLDARREALAEAVEKGDLTQEQADAILAHMEECLEEHPEHLMEGCGPGMGWEGHGPGMGWGGRGPGMGWGNAETSMLDVAAEALDMTPGQLWDELRAGKSLEDIAAEKGLEPKDLAQAFLDARREALAEAVEKGDLTQEQADAILAHMEECLEEHPEHLMGGYGPGMGRGGHGPGMGWEGRGPGWNQGMHGPGMGWEGRGSGWNQGMHGPGWNQGMRGYRQ